MNGQNLCRKRIKLVMAAVGLTWLLLSCRLFYWQILCRGPLMEALKNAKGYLRRALGKRMIIRTSPELIFVSDRNIEYGVHIARVLADVKAAAPAGTVEE